MKYVDFTKYLKQGENLIAVFARNMASHCGVIAEFKIEYSNGTTDTIITDSGDNYSYIKGLSWLGSLIMNPAASDDLGWGFEIKFMTYSLHTPNAYKIHLKPCMEITGGTGDFATPYKLKNNCS